MNKNELKENFEETLSYNLCEMEIYINTSVGFYELDASSYRFIDFEKFDNEFNEFLEDFEYELGKVLDDYPNSKTLLNEFFKSKKEALGDIEDFNWNDDSFETFKEEFPTFEELTK